MPRWDRSLEALQQGTAHSGPPSKDVKVKMDLWVWELHSDPSSWSGLCSCDQRKDRPEALQSCCGTSLFPLQLPRSGPVSLAEHEPELKSCDAPGV